MKKFEGIKIWCETKEERDAVLKKMEEQGIRWSDGRKPTEWKLCGVELPYGLLVGCAGTMCYEKNKVIFDSTSYKEISVSYYLGHESKKEIHITTDGTNIYAIMKENGKVIKRAVAKCCQEDEFEFEAGARLAFERLFTEEKIHGLIHAGLSEESGNIAGINVCDEDLVHLFIRLLKKLMLHD